MVLTNKYGYKHCNKVTGIATKEKQFLAGCRWGCLPVLCKIMLLCTHVCVFMKACAFLNQYKQLRGECQESYYNLGRAMHQLGMVFCFHFLCFYLLLSSSVFLSETLVALVWILNFYSN